MTASGSESGGIARRPEGARRSASRHRVNDDRQVASARVRAALDERARRGTMTGKAKPPLQQQTAVLVSKRSAQALAMRKAAQPSRQG